VHITKREILEEAYRMAKTSGGAPGINRQSFEDIGASGRESLLNEVRQTLTTGKGESKPNRKMAFPKSNGKVRMLQIPRIRDRVVQVALKLMVANIYLNEVD
jgi:retron-type reverse transcriptase